MNPMVMRIRLTFNTCLDNGVRHSILMDELNINPIPGALVLGSNSMKETAGSATTRMLS